MIRLKDVVWYMHENRVHNAPVLSIVRIENAHDESWVCTEQQEDMFHRFGPTGTRYATLHGVFTRVFASKTELLASL